MTKQEIIAYIHEYNARILEIAERAGLSILTATAITDSDEQSISGGVVSMSDGDICASLIGINHYFSNKMIEDGF